MRYRGAGECAYLSAHWMFLDQPFIVGVVHCLLVKTMTLIKFISKDCFSFR